MNHLEDTLQIVFAFVLLVVAVGLLIVWVHLPGVLTWLTIFVGFALIALSAVAFTGRK